MRMMTATSPHLRPPARIFCDRSRVVETFRGKRVALVGSGPGVLQNHRGFVDSHDVVVRVNNWKLSVAAGQRVDVFYSFFGASIRIRASQAKAAGVKLCICKCPNDHAIESEWHLVNGKMRGVDFRPIYKERSAWWFCPTYIPSLSEFQRKLDILGGHVPTTGFSALLDILDCEPESVYMTGFDFFESGVHNVNERWKPGNPQDPIRHVPQREAQWVAEAMNRHPITADARLQAALQKYRRRAA